MDMGGNDASVDNPVQATKDAGTAAWWGLIEVTQSWPKQPAARMPWRFGMGLASESAGWDLPDRMDR